MFSDYFINVVQNLRKDLGESNNEFLDYLKNPNKQFLFKRSRPRGNA